MGHQRYPNSLPTSGEQSIAVATSYILKRLCFDHMIAGHFGSKITFVSKTIFCSLPFPRESRSKAIKQVVSSIVDLNP